MIKTPFIAAVNRLIPYMRSYSITICNKYDASVNHVEECPDLEDHLIGRMLTVWNRLIMLEVNLTTNEYKFSSLAGGTITGRIFPEDLAYLKEHLF